MTRVIVLDASAGLEAVLGRTHAVDVLEAVATAQEVLAPELYAPEVANALWKHVRVGDLDPDQAHDFLDKALALLDRLVASSELVTEALATAVAHGHPVYDALYAVAARRRGAVVWTRDKRLGELLAAMKVELVRLD